MLLPTQPSGGWKLEGRCDVLERRSYNVYRRGKMGRHGGQRHVRGMAVRAAAQEEENQSGGFLDGLFKPFGQVASGTMVLRAGESNDKNDSIFGTLGFGKKSGGGRMDPNTVLVAGSTGRLGLRIVHELASAGFKVRAGVRSQEKADIFDELMADLCESIGPLDARARNNIKIVYCDLQDEESIQPAIGNASRVVCAVGAAESEFTNLAAPKKIDFEATENLINVAASSNIRQFVLVTSLGTGKIGFPAGVLNLFGGILIWKRKAEEALERSGMPYLIVRPGGMERPKDDHKLTHNVTLSSRDTLFGGTVSRLQVAELVASALVSPEVSMNKCIEVVAETKVPLKEYEMLLNEMPCEVEQESREEMLVRIQQLEAQEENVLMELEEAKEGLSNVRERIAELQGQLADARSEAKEVKKEATPVLREAASVESKVEALADRASVAALEASAAKAVVKEAQKGVREGKILSSTEIQAIRQSILSPPPEKEDEVKTEERPSLPLFGGFASVKKTNKPVEKIEEEERVEEVPKSEKKQGGSFLDGFTAFLEGDGRKAATDSQKQEEELEEEEEEQLDNENQSNEIGGFLGSFANIFTNQETVYVDEEEVKETKEQQSVTPVVANKDEPQSPASENAFVSFGKLFGFGGETMYADDEPVPEPAEKVLEQPKRSAPQAVAEIEKPMVVKETLTVVEEETPAVVEEETPAVAQKEMPAVVEEETPAVAQKEMPAVVEEETTAVIQEEKAPVEEKEMMEVITPEDSNVPDNVMQARKWIAAWRARDN